MDEKLQTNNVDEKREQLQDILIELSDSQKKLQEEDNYTGIIKKLEDLYYGEKQNYRHYYNDIFAIISTIAKEEDKSLDILAENMRIIHSVYEPDEKGFGREPKNIRNELNKLYDHINLEIARLHYFNTSESNTEGKLKNLTDTLNNVEDKLKKMEATEEKIDDMQKQYITILGIFASIVITFTGGTAFSTSVLQNIANASIYRISLIVFVLAFSLTNIVYILTRFIREISKKKDEIIKYPRYMIVLNVIYGLCILIIVVSQRLNLY